MVVSVQEMELEARKAAEAASKTTQPSLAVKDQRNARLADLDRQIADLQRTLSRLQAERLVLVFVATCDC